MHQLEVVDAELLCGGLVGIGSYAFAGCTSLRCMKMPSSLRMIDEYAFIDCEQLVDVVLCEGLRLIERCAFSGCSSLKSFKVPSTVKIIAEDAFQYCEQLEMVELCEGLVRIDEGAFYGCEVLERIKSMKLPSTLKVIGMSAFYGCKQLEDVDLCEGLERIESGAFNGCESLKSMKVPSTVEEIGDQAFCGCEHLVEVDLCEGIDQISMYTFWNCRSLQGMKIPASVKTIGDHAFALCRGLVEVELSEGVEQIEEGAFSCVSLQRVSFPSTTKEIGEEAFFGCLQLKSVELCDGIEKIGTCAFGECFSLRNASIPSGAQVSESSFRGCYDLLRLFGSEEMIIDELTSRFKELPIHKLCYYQSEDVIELLTSTGLLPDNNKVSLIVPSVVHAQDCLGMTPLHILACSSAQNLGLYRFIVANSPSSLITEDKWGCVPLLYAIWSDAPHEIVQFLIDSQKSAFPNHALDWDKMIENLCRAEVSIDAVKRLLDIHQASFPGETLDWQKAAQELAIRFLFDHSNNEDCDSSFRHWGVEIEALNLSGVHQELIQRLMAMQQRFFANESEFELRNMCEEIVQPLTGWWQPGKTEASLDLFHFLVKCNIAERLNKIGVRKWRVCLENQVKMLPLDDLIPLVDINSELVTYEQEYSRLEEAAFLLELALWKSAIDGSMANREECRINCGADMIIPNVLPFLIAPALDEEVDDGADQLPGEDMDQLPDQLQQENDQL